VDWVTSESVLVAWWRLLKGAVVAGDDGGGFNGDAVADITKTA